MAKETTNLGLYEAESTDGSNTYNITTMLNNNWDKIDANVAKKTDIPTKTSELTNDGNGTHNFVTTDQMPSSLPANGGNSTTVNNHTAAATPVTTEKTDIIGMVNEVKNETYTKSESDLNIANIEIGGRNLLQKNNFKSGWDSIVTSVDNYNDIPTYDVKVNTPDRDSNFGMYIVNNIPIALNNDYITVSFYYKIISYSNLESLNLRGYIQIKYSNNSTYNFILANNYVDFLNQDNWGKWHKLTYTFKTSSSLSAIAISAFYIYADFASIDSEIQLTIPKIEFGNKATDWTPAPEDQQAYVDTNIQNSVQDASAQPTNQMTGGVWLAPI